MPEGEGGQQLPYAGTREMDDLIQQINQNPAIMQQIIQNYPQLVDEIMKHIGKGSQEGAPSDDEDTEEAAPSAPPTEEDYEDEEAA